MIPENIIRDLGKFGFAQADQEKKLKELVALTKGRSSDDPISELVCTYVKAMIADLNRNTQYLHFCILGIKYIEKQKSREK